MTRKRGAMRRGMNEMMIDLLVTLVIVIALGWIVRDGVQ